MGIGFYAKSWGLAVDIAGDDMLCVKWGAFLHKRHR